MVNRDGGVAGLGQGVIVQSRPCGQSTLSQRVCLSLPQVQDKEHCQR